MSEGEREWLCGAQCPSCTDNAVFCRKDPSNPHHRHIHEGEYVAHRMYIHTTHEWGRQ